MKPMDISELKKAVEEADLVSKWNNGKAVETHVGTMVSLDTVLLKNINYQLLAISKLAEVQNKLLLAILESNTTKPPVSRRNKQSGICQD